MPAKTLPSGNEPDAVNPSTASEAGGPKKAASRGRSNSKKGTNETNADSTGNAETAKAAANGSTPPAKTANANESNPPAKTANANESNPPAKTANESTHTDAAASKKGAIETNTESARNAETAKTAANTTGSAGPGLVATDINWESWADPIQAPTMSIQQFIQKHHPGVKDTLLTRFLVAWAAKGIPITGTEEVLNNRVRIFMEEKKTEDTMVEKYTCGIPTGAGKRDLFNEEGGYDSEGEPVTTVSTATPATRAFTYHKKVPKVVQSAVEITPIEQTFRTDMKSALLTYIRAVQANITLFEGNKGIALSSKAVRWFGERDKAEGLEMAWALDRNEKWRTACNDMAEEGGYSGPEGQEMYNMAVRAVVLATSTVNMKANGGQVTTLKVQHFLDRADHLLGKGTVGLALNKSEQQALESLTAVEDHSTQRNVPANTVGFKRPQSSDQYDRYQNHAQRTTPMCWSCGKQGHQSTVCNRFDRRLPFKPH